MTKTLSTTTIAIVLLCLAASAEVHARLGKSFTKNGNERRAEENTVKRPNQGSDKNNADRQLFNDCDPECLKHGFSIEECCWERRLEVIDESEVIDEENMKNNDKQETDVQRELYPGCDPDCIEEGHPYFLCCPHRKLVDDATAAAHRDLFNCNPECIERGDPAIECCVGVRKLESISEERELNGDSCDSECLRLGIDRDICCGDHIHRERQLIVNDGNIECLRCLRLGKSVDECCGNHRELKTKEAGVESNEAAADVTDSFGQRALTCKGVDCDDPYADRECCPLRQRQLSDEERRQLNDPSHCTEESPCGPRNHYPCDDVFCPLGQKCWADIFTHEFVCL